jgi:Spy/CpxP family protein refolding chaperone
MKMQILTVAAVAFMVAPMLHAQDSTTRAGTASAQTGVRVHTRARAGQRHTRNGMADLGLTADQQSRMKAIHTRYAAQLKATRKTSRPNFEAMKAARTSGDTAAQRVAREKMRSDMAPAMKLRQQEMTETRAVLTADQQKKLDARRAEMKARMAKRTGHDWAGKRRAKPAQPPKPASPISPVTPAR